MDLSEVERFTRRALPDWSESELEFRPIEKGGSGRLFVRVVEARSGESVIAMHYSDDRSDNARFAGITDFLNRQLIAAPEILARREDLGLLWVTDLGELDLGNLDQESWESVRRPAFEKTLRVVRRLHSLTEADPPDDLPGMELSFDERLYRWEQEYFLNQFVARFGKPAGAPSDAGETAADLIEASDLVDLRHELAGLPRALVHRDFQSTNVMIRSGEPYLIDYQGLRWGLPEYDLASLVYDPYTTLTPDQREHLVEFYWELSEGEGRGGHDDFVRRLHRCGMQRLMQALGAYGYLAEVKGKRDFLRHIPVATSRLAALAQGDHGIPWLAEILAE